MNGRFTNVTSPEQHKFLPRLIKHWDATTLREKARIHTNNVLMGEAAVSPKGELLAVGTTDGKVRFWSFRSHSEEPGISGLSGYVSPFFSPDGKRLVTIDEENGRLWNLGNEKREAANLHLEKTLMSTATFSPDGRMLASAGADRQVKLWDTTVLGRLASPFQPGRTFSYPTRPNTLTPSMSPLRVLA